MAINKDPKTIWKTTLAQIEIKLDSQQTYKTFFTNTQLVTLENSKAVIGVHNGYMHDWLKQKYTTLIQETLSHVYGHEVEIDFEILPDYAKGTPLKLEKNEATKMQKLYPGSENSDGDLLSTAGGIHESVTAALQKSGLNDKYSLSNYVVGSANRIAHAAAQAIIKQPGQSYNPLFLHGSTGVGKTHLAQAIARAVLERNPHRKVVYTSAEGFLNDMVRSLKSAKMQEFRNRYRAISILIIDDIQLISKWVETQTEFFNTFNELHNQNNQVILVADRPPEEIKNLEDRLRSRFQGGLVVDISRPEFELRLAIVEKKANQFGFQLPQTWLELIAQNVEDNIRELEGAVQKVALYNQMKKDGELSTLEIMKIIGQDAGSKREKVKVPSVIKLVGKQFGVSVKDLKGSGRTKELAMARQVAMYILREELEYNLQEVAEYLNRSDHTTVMHAADKVQSLMTVDPQFKQIIVGIIKTLEEGPLED